MVAALVCAFFMVALAEGATTRKPSSGTASKTTSTKKKRQRKKKSRGQKAIDAERVTQIQEALAREHYLRGEPSGKWDAATQAAMKRYQADNGWQDKTVPDSRALIKLGLGPNHDHLLNPETAMTSAAMAGAKSDARPATADSPAASPPANGTPAPQP